MISEEKLVTTFFDVLNDLKEYLNNLTLVGGWLPYIYSKFLWKDCDTLPITTIDIDFGLGDKKAKYSKTIFEQFSNLDYEERHIKMDRMYPVVMYKKGQIPIDFITFPAIQNENISNIVGSQIKINKIENFEFLLKYKICIEIKNKDKIIKIFCPKPSAFLYHKCLTFIDREYEEKQAKDLYYIYFILRYASDIKKVFAEIKQYNKQESFKNIYKNLENIFDYKTGKGCLMVEKEHGKDLFLIDLRQDIFEKFRSLIKILKEY